MNKNTMNFDNPENQSQDQEMSNIEKSKQALDKSIVDFFENKSDEELRAAYVATGTSSDLITEEYINNFRDQVKNNPQQVLRDENIFVGLGEDSFNQFQGLKNQELNIRNEQVEESLSQKAEELKNDPEELRRFTIDNSQDIFDRVAVLGKLKKEGVNEEAMKTMYEYAISAYTSEVAQTERTPASNERQTILDLTRDIFEQGKRYPGKGNEEESSDNKIADADMEKPEDRDRKIDDIKDKLGGAYNS